MRIVVNYRSIYRANLPVVLTKWTKVSFTYIVVSRSFSGAYSDIWATVAEVQDQEIAAANSALVPVDLIGLAFTKTANPPTNCGAYSDSGAGANQGFNYAAPGGAIPTKCSSAVIPTPTTNAQGGRLIVHSYIMGFGFDPARSTNRYLAASVVMGKVFGPLQTIPTAVGTFPDVA